MRLVAAAILVLTLETGVLDYDECCPAGTQNRARRRIRDVSREIARCVAVIGAVIVLAGCGGSSRSAPSTSMVQHDAHSTTTTVSGSTTTAEGGSTTTLRTAHPEPLREPADRVVLLPSVSVGPSSYAVFALHAVDGPYTVNLSASALVCPFGGDPDGFSLTTTTLNRCDPAVPGVPVARLGGGNSHSGFAIVAREPVQTSVEIKYRAVDTFFVFRPPQDTGTSRHELVFTPRTSGPVVVSLADRATAYRIAVRQGDRETTTEITGTVVQAWVADVAAGAAVTLALESRRETTMAGALMIEWN
jgi:hypothetical protein